MLNDSSSTFDFFLLLLTFLKRIASFVSVYFPNIANHDHDDDDAGYGKKIGTYGF